MQWNDLIPIHPLQERGQYCHDCRTQNPAYIPRTEGPFRQRQRFAQSASIVVDPLTGHFRNQVRFWGIEASYAFVSQPQTNGVAERFVRTLKEQVVHGRVFRNTEDLRAAVADFVEKYNEHWPVEKNGFVSPRKARELHGLRRVA